MYSERVQSYIDKNPFAKLADVITFILREDIVSLAYPPGDKLNVSTIAKELGVSRSPVVEAVNSLSELGFVTKSDATNGFYASPLSIDELLRLYSVRSAIEGEAAYRCAKYADEATVKELESLARKFEFALKSRDPIAVKSVDLPFHHTIISACRNEFIEMTYDRFYPILRRYQWFCSERLKNTVNNPWCDEIVYQHIFIVDAIKSHNPNLARSAMQEHISACINYALNPSLSFELSD